MTVYLSVLYELTTAIQYGVSSLRIPSSINFFYLMDLEFELEDLDDFW